MDERRAVSRGPLPLSPKATLKWLALAGDSLTPVTMDSSSVVRSWSPAFGGAWARTAPVAEGGAAAGVWPTGVSGGELHYVQCDAGESPQVCPHAVLSLRLRCHGGDVAAVGTAAGRPESIDSDHTPGSGNLCPAC